MAKRKVEIFWNKKEENSLRFWYRTKNPFRIIFNFLVIWFCKYIPSLSIKQLLYRIIGIKIGKNVSIGLGATFDIFFPELIEIGENSIIGYDTLILTHEFLIDNWRKGKVEVGKNVMIGARCLILPGVKIGDNVKIAAYSLVNKNIPKNCFVGGIPAKKLGRT